MTYEPGQIVKYAKPQNAEEAALRFEVIEDRDTRLFVSVVGHGGLGANECFAKAEYELAYSNHRYFINRAREMNSMRDASHWQ